MAGRLQRPCKVCKKNFEDCKHSVVDEVLFENDARTREIVRMELALMEATK